MKDDGCYYHVDLLRSNVRDQFREYTDAEMGNYVWDYSAYPVCIGAVAAESVEKTAISEESEKN